MARDLGQTRKARTEANNRVVDTTTGAVELLKQ